LHNEQSLDGTDADTQASLPAPFAEQLPAAVASRRIVCRGTDLPEGERITSLPDGSHSQTGTTWLDALLPAYRRLRRMADMTPEPKATTLDEESQAD
jgi:hypothetical protein